MRSLHTDPFALGDDDFLMRAKQMCATKAAYINRAQATATTKRFRHPGTPYLCPWCSCYHITTYDRARAKAFMRRLSRLLRTNPDPDLTETDDKLPFEP